MNKKGFTLVELLAVIVILGIILAIAIPSITGMIKSSAKSSFESNAKLVLKAIDYKKLETDNFDPTSVNKNTINSLLGLSNDNYENLKVTIEDNIPIISIIGKGKWEGFIACGTYHNMKVVESAIECNADNVPPIITILGTNPVSINQGDTYIDAGATAEDNIDGDISSKIVVTSNVNPNIPGTYTVTYSVTDNAGNKSELTRVVNVIDNVAPVITILGNNPITIKRESIYIDAGATALDDADGDVTSKIIVTSTVNPNIIGTYTVTYTVKDNANNISTASRTVNVITAVPEGWIAIRTRTDLYNIRNNLTGNYYVDNDIDLATSHWTPIDNFAGNFDGGNHKINGLYVIMSNQKGLFGIINASNIEIKNLELTNVRIIGYSYSGALIGKVTGSNIKITNVHASGTVTSSGSSACVENGGLIGYASGVIINGCSMSGSVTSTGISVGGLVGTLENSSISKSYSTADVTARYQVGGLIATASISSIEKSYATGNVTATDNYVYDDADGTKHQARAGGLVGNSFRTTITDCYALGSVRALESLTDSNMGGLVG